MTYYNNKPYHSLDLNQSGWTVFPSKEGDIRTYGRFRLYWKTIPNPRKINNQYYSYEPEYIVKGYISIDNGPWIEYDWNWQYKNKQIEEELRTEIRKVRSLFQKERAKQKAKERKIYKENLAKKQGITVEELDQKNRKKRLEKKEQKKAITVIRQTNDILKAGPVIKNLYDELGSFLELMNSGKQVNITYLDYKLRHFRTVQNILRTWRKLPTKN